MTDHDWLVEELRERADRLLRVLLGLQAAIPLPPLEGAITEVEMLALLIEQLEQVHCTIQTTDSWSMLHTPEPVVASTQSWP